MIFRYIGLGTHVIDRSNKSFLIKLSMTKDIWVFNCIEGFQSNIFSQDFKINNISKIIITNLHIENISGLLGLLSSLNLIGRLKSLHIYAPIDLKYYLDLGKKYSKTNFNYVVYLHILKTGLVANHQGCRIYAFCNTNSYEFIIMQPEDYGTFFLDQARRNYLAPGPLYGKLKKGCTFVLPDGFIIDGRKLTSMNLKGNQLCLLINCFYKRKILESSTKSRLVLFS
uniref:Ribonuclease Z n=1 Tax=Digenea simplex TaxID=945030 RepID=A0A1Z1MUG6_DIGSM|nr:ribonuclease Z [Digenea simplex]ARW69452.1 ribonuclease Z [Digenea simplex]